MNEDARQLLESSMRDLHLPAAISWWPPAPGWWLLAVLVLLAAGLSVAQWHRHRRRKDPRWQAVSRLEQCHSRWQIDRQAAVYLQQSSHILRQLAIALAGREQVSRLSGKAWADWLDSDAVPLSADTRRAITVACYQKDIDVSIEQVHVELRRCALSCYRVTSSGRTARV